MSKLTALTCKCCGGHGGKLKEQIIQAYQKGWNDCIDAIIDNVPTVDLRLMKCEECAGHTLDYAMGWKACIEWIKKGGAE